MKTAKHADKSAARVSALILKKFGIPGADKIVEEALKGTSLKDVNDLFRQLGFRTLVGEMDVSCLRLFVDKGWPVVALLNDGVVVVSGVDHGRVFFDDPREGATEDPVSAFMARWAVGDAVQQGVVVWQD